MAGITNKIDTNNELSLALTGSLNFSSWVIGSLELLRNGTTLRRRRTRGRISLLSTEAWRRTAGTALGRTTHGRRSLTHGIHIWGRISNRRTSVDGRRASSHLARRGTVAALVRRGAITRTSRRAGRIVGRVARRAIASRRVIHLETGGRRRGADGRRLSWERNVVLRYLTWRRGTCGRDPVGCLDAG